MSEVQSPVMPGIGYLYVKVTAGDNALPIEGATVTVTSGRGDKTILISTQTTGKSGETSRIELPAPSRELSQSPGNKNTYAKYNVRIDYPGYYTVENIDVPVFDGQLSIQPTQMIPLPLNDKNGKKTSVIESEPEL